MLADEAVISEDRDVPATRPASSSSMSSSCPPVDGLRRFSRDGVDGVFMGAAGVPLRYRLFPKYSEGREGRGKLRPGVVLLTGLMESMAKYGETIAHLNDSGFSVYTFDHQGQGLSGRLPVPSTADPRVAHIADFDHYVQDLVHFSKAVLPATVEPHRSSIKAARVPGAEGGTADDRAAMGEGEDASSEGGRRMSLSVVGHSMGGLVAVKAAIQEPLLFDGLVLAAPMFAPNTGKLANGVVGAVAWGATKLGQGYRQERFHDMIASRRSPIRRPARATMEWSRVTHDKRRLRLWETLRGRVGCVLQRGPSFAWLSMAIGASKRARREVGKLAVPVLVLEAGQDRMVRSDGIERFRRRAPKTLEVRYRLFEGAYHDLFDETDDIRLEVLRETCSFLSAATTGLSKAEQR
ncbi:unnamed protein product [Scytosiphon promiscuus]